ncbi:hypothetical protein QWY86_00830 [Pedobacter aquatilis]|uniref:hypothetical protein n=1 Tax=Pedobacter aquatilis TaxID=351343 RepID=UPI0025B2D68E|nr:hypothetical protein [Pedobacter aquatilis]MDN3585192.1 hypothetical protein [Pedobacter aquatilis]
MKKTHLLCFLLFISISSAFSQNKNIVDLYDDYTTIRMTPDEKPKAIAIGLSLLNRKSELKPKQIANVTYHVARLLEETNMMSKAIPYYEESIKLTPGYYVPYLALGNEYFKTCKELVAKMNQAADANDTALHGKLSAEYKPLANKTASYLEKSYACDPDDITKGMITYLYQTLKNTEAIKSFDTRIKQLEQGCITLLDDE